MAQSLRKESVPRLPGVKTAEKAIFEVVGTGRVPRRRPRPRPARQTRGWSLQTKLVGFTVFSLVLLAVTSGVISTMTLQNQMTQEFQSKGVAIARSLSSSGVELILNRDGSTLQALVDQFASIEGVAYVLIYNSDLEIYAHTFSPFIPEGLVQQNEVPGEATMQMEKIQITDPADSTLRNILDIGIPVLAGQLGTVRVGMDLDLVAGQSTSAALQMLVVLAALAFVTALLGWWFAHRTVAPVHQLAQIAERVGRGDLSQLASVTSKDEIGFLADTFNDSIVHLRDLVQTQEERDRERQQRGELDQSIGRFLEVATEIAQGDLTKRGDVTEDVLGSVVDAINVMVEEIGETLQGVQKAANTVHINAAQMMNSTGQMLTGAQSQAGETRKMSEEAENLTASVRAMSDGAQAAAEAARKTLEASQKGQLAVQGTLDGMQRIRGEVQGISKRIKSLGDRSMEISEIVETISSISSQTNLLALNAAIEASGAGEEGVRFAVVADEVRKLAEDSAKATKHIARLIKTVQTEIQEAVVAMEEGTREVENGFRITRQAGEQLEEIATISQSSSQLAEEITVRSQQGVDGVEKMAQGVSSIAEIATVTEHSVAKGRQVAEQLAALAGDLTERLSRFRLAS